MTKTELLKRVGSVEQIGGIRDVTINDGKGKGVRALIIDTGCLSLTVLPDRCMDIAQAKYKGTSLSWISKTGITSPMYYDKDGATWLRGFYGGLVTTCGLKNIGGPVNGQGLHGRIANTPAEKVSIFCDWVGDEYVMEVSGLVRESSVFGENLLLKRKISTKLFSNEFTLSDTVVNESFNDEDFCLCYHCNLGYPLVSEKSSFFNVPKEFCEITAPTHNKAEECIAVDYTDDVVTVGIENENLGLYITYNRDTLPDFLIWKTYAESEYAIGLEPRTTVLGGQELLDKNKYVTLKPFEEYKTNLKFTVCEK